MRKLTSTPKLFIVLLQLFVFQALHAQTTIDIGTGTQTNNSSSFPCPLQDYNEASRQQFLYTAAELSAAGMSFGTISAIKFNATNLNGFSGSIEQLKIKIRKTTASKLGDNYCCGSGGTFSYGWIDSAALVYGPVDYTPTVGINTFSFSTPFSWDGTSNLLIEICNGSPTATTGSYFSENPSITYTATSNYYAQYYVIDDINGVCSTTATATVSFNRPNISFDWSIYTCSGAPGTKPIIVTSTLCQNNQFALKDTFNNGNFGITYQWQSSPDSTNWNDIAGATTNQYSSTQNDYIVYYRSTVKCAGSGITSYSKGIKLVNNNFAPTVYASLPLTESFENWGDYHCDYAPVNYWKQKYQKSYTASGGTIPSWGRNDDSWYYNPYYIYNQWGGYSPYSGDYSPVYTYGGHSARFHGSATEYGDANGGWHGDDYQTLGFIYNGEAGLDLYINCNTAYNTKKLSFDFIANNQVGIDVFLSTNGGTSFTKIDSNFTGFWDNRIIYFNSTSATTVIRFLGVTRQLANYYTTDAAIDHLIIQDALPCTGSPNKPGIKTTNATTVYCSSQNIALFDTVAAASSVAYQWQSSPDTSTWTNIPVATGRALNTTIPAATKLYYRLSATCLTTNLVSNSNAIQITNRLAYANIPYAETFSGTWINGCNTADLPSNKWINTKFNNGRLWQKGTNAAVLNANWVAYQKGLLGHSQLDLLINCNTGSPQKRLEFTVSKTDPYDSLEVYLSIDSGNSFAKLACYKAVVNNQLSYIVFNASSNKCIIRFNGVSDTNVYRYSAPAAMYLSNLNVYDYAPCTGNPTAGYITDGGSNLVLNNYTKADGIKIQWQSSSDSMNWGNAPDTVYFTPKISLYYKQYYRAIVKCANSGLADTTTVYSVMNSSSKIKPGKLPYFNGFETPYVNDSSLAIGNVVTYWTNITSTGATGKCLYGQKWGSSWDGPGFLDIYLDCSSGDSVKALSFRYNTTTTAATSFTNSINVKISTNGGLSFSGLATGLNSAGWATYQTNFKSKSAYIIIRLETVPYYTASGGFYFDDFSVTEACVSNLNGGATHFQNCGNTNMVLSVTGATTTAEVATLQYQWQSSTDSINWNNIASATNSTYLTPPVNNIYFRLQVSCVSGNTVFSTPVKVVNSLVYYASLPFSEGFETAWIENCVYTGGTPKSLPNTYWSVKYDKYDSSWRRSDDTLSGYWTNRNRGSYTYPAPQGSYSARFHSSGNYTSVYYPYNGVSISSYMDLRLNCTSSRAAKILTYNFINPSGVDYLKVYLSTDSGKTFAVIDSTNNALTWQLRSIDFNSTSAATVLRFEASNGIGSDSTDLGIDNISVNEPNKYAIANGNWGDATTWNGSTVPVSTDNVLIGGYNVTLAGSAGSPYSCNTLIVDNGGNLVVNSNTLNIGKAGGDNKMLVVRAAATLNIGGGNINLNGNFLLRNAGNFIMSNGNFKVDGNDSTDIGSVADAIDLFGIGKAFDKFYSLTGTFTVTGGKITIIDPHSSNNSFSLAYWNNTNLSIAFSGSSTLQLGDSVSTQKSNNTNTSGFYCQTICPNAPTNSKLTLNNLIINGRSNKRVANFTSNLTNVAGVFTATYGSEATFINLTINGATNLDWLTKITCANNLTCNQTLQTGQAAKIFAAGLTVAGNTTIGVSNYLGITGGSSFNGDLYLSQSTNLISYQLSVAGNLNMRQNTYVEVNDDLNTYSNSISGTFTNYYGQFYAKGGYLYFYKDVSLSQNSWLKSKGNVSFYGSLVNDGNFVNTSRTYIVGTTYPHTISGSGIYYNSFNTNTSNYNFTHLNVSGPLTIQSFGTGYSSLKANCKNLTIGAGVSITVPQGMSLWDTLTNTSGYIIGKLKRRYNAATNFTTTGDFPVTKGNKYRNARIEYTVASTHGGWIGVEFIDSTPGKNGLPVQDDISLTSVENDGYWKVEADSVTGGFFTLSLSSSNSNMGNKVVNLGTLRTLRRNGSIDNWLSSGVKGTNLGSVSNPTVVRTGLNSLGDFVIAGGNDNALFYPRTDTLKLAGCYSVIYKGNTYTTAQTIKDTLKTTGGIDSVYRIAQISILSAGIGSVNQTIYGCSGIVFNGVTYTTSTIVTDTLKSIVTGCDSLYRNTTITLSNTLVINVSASTTAICPGKKITFSATGTTGITPLVYTWKKNGNTVGTNSNIYADSTLNNNDSVWCVLSTTNACATSPSAVSNKIKVTVYTSISSTVEITILAGSNYVFHGQALTTAGTYASTFTSSLGCDSIANLTLFVLSPAPCYPGNGTTLHSSTSVSTAIDYVQIVYTPLHTSIGGIDSLNGRAYSFYSDPSIMPTLTAGNTYILNTFFRSNVIASVWFDWNGNGSFETTEWTQLTTNAANGSINFNVPIAAISGKIIMRIRSRSVGSSNGASNACTTFSSGETEDYLVNIVQPIPCTGLPVGGTTVSSPDEVCSGQVVYLSVTNGTAGNSGLSYIWQQSNDSINWNTIAGATSLDYYPAITGNIYFRRSITCSTSTAYSTPVLVKFNTPVYASLPFYEGFDNAWINGCDQNNPHSIPSNSFRNNPTFGNASWRRNDDAASAGWSSPTNGGAAFLNPSGGYAARMHTYATSATGILDLYLNCSGGTSNNRLQYYFVNAAGTDKIRIYLSTDAGISFIKLDSATISTIWKKMTVDFVSTSANTILRFAATGDNGSSDIGLDSVYVMNLPNCTTPAGGTAISSSNPTCKNQAFNLGVEGDSQAQGGLGYQWQISADGINYTDINGATNATYAATGIIVKTYYRRKIICNYGGAIDYSIPIGIDVSLPGIGITANQTTICAGTKVSFTSLVLNGGTAPVYQWVKNGVNVGNNSSTYTDSLLNNQDSVWCVVTSNSSCVAIATVSSNKIYFTVNTIPAKPAITGDTIIAVAGTIDLNAIAAGANTYSWTGPNGYNSTNQNISITNATYTQAGIYTVQANNSCGSSLTSSVKVTVVARKPRTLMMDKVSCYSGNNVVVNVRTKNFTNIAGLQGTIVWDTSVLKYNAFIAGSNGISLDSNGNIGLTNTAKGMLSYSWGDTTGHTTADSSILFGIRFTPLISSATPSSVMFSSNPTGLEIDTFNIVGKIPVETFDTSYLAGYVIPVAKPTVIAGYNTPIALGDTLILTAAGSLSNDYIWNGPNGFTATTQNASINNVGLVNAGVYYVSANYLGCVGNADSVNVNVLTTLNIAGTIKTPNGDTINNVTVNLKGFAANSYNTSTTSKYNFDVTAKKSYYIQPYKNNDVNKTNGVSTLDIILTTSHILQKNPFTSPLKIIAADVNADNKVGTIDIIFMKRLILGIDTTFRTPKGNMLWRFIDSSYAFPNPSLPFPVPDSINVSIIITNKPNQSFIGIKLGDVNFNWSHSVPRFAKTNNVELEYSGINNNSGKAALTEQPIAITVKNFNELLSLQYTLHFDNSKYEFVRIDNNKLGIEFNAKSANETGDISMLWADANVQPKTLKDGTDLFTLIVSPRENNTRSMQSIQLKLTNSITGIEAWDKDYLQHDVVLTKKSAVQLTMDLFTVTPNPTKGIVKLGIWSAERKTVKFELSNSQGKSLLHFNSNVTEGNNTIIINLKERGNLPAGVYFIKAIDIAGEKAKQIIIE